MTGKVASESSGVDALKWVVVALLAGVAIWSNEFYSDVSPLYRALGVLLLAVIAVAVALQTPQGKRFNSLRKESLVELRKVVWPTRPEALQTTAMVVVFVALVALLLFFFDWVLGGVVSWLIG